MHPEVSETVPVNPPGELPLTRVQVWGGLVMKAEDATRFVPGMTRCEVLERTSNGLVREAVHNGHTLRERVTFDRPREVYFERIVPADGSWVRNTLTEENGELLLTFTFAVPPEEGGEEMRADYRKAIEGTLAKCRELVAENKL